MKIAKTKRGRRIVFWGTVAGVAVVADLVLHHASEMVRSPGLARLMHGSSR